MAKMSLGEALDTFGDDLLIAATGAIAKKGSGPGGEVRVIYDGTNGIFLNYGIRIRDQIKFPGAPDIKAVLANATSLPQPPVPSPFLLPLLFFTSLSLLVS